MAPNEKLCFVIMPYGPAVDVGEVGGSSRKVDFDAVYKNLIEPAVVAEGIDCKRSDHSIAPGSIHEEMFSLIYRAGVCVVDITALNPNVFYELGVRHALRDWVTVIIRRQGEPIPFNINGSRVLEYPDLPYDQPNDPEVKRAQASIGSAIRAGLLFDSYDSPVTRVVEKLAAPAEVSGKESVRFNINPGGDNARAISILAGDLRDVEGVDIWVNSENTDMQMARWFDRSVSSTIRYLGAEKGIDGYVKRDTIADELELRTSGRSVAPGQVVVTGPGDLAKPPMDVKWIFHVASVTGQFGVGYRPIHDVAACVTNVLREVDSLKRDIRLEGDEDGYHVLFPLLGTGTGRASVTRTAKRLIEKAVTYLKRHPESIVREVSFLARTDEDYAACVTVLNESKDTEEINA